MISGHMTSLLRDVAILFPAILFVFTFRGFAKALVAKLMGDRTAEREGFLTLNPVAHVDVLGFSVVLLVIFLLSLFLGGRLITSVTREVWFLLLLVGVRLSHSVPFEPRNFKSFKLGSILTLLSGSIGCFLGAFLFMYIIAYLPVKLFSISAYKSLIEIFVYTVHLFVFFGVLTLTPVPPFDGGRLLQLLLPSSKQRFVSFLEEYSLFIILALFFLPIVSDFYFAIIDVASRSVLSFLSLFVF